MDRRKFLQLGGMVAAGSVIARSAGAAPPVTSTPATPATRAPTVAPTRELAVVTPNGSTLPWKVVDGVKVGHLIAEPIDHEFAPGLRAACWGYNGSTPGPTLEAVEGDRLRIYVTNRLPEPTTVHWHGIILPNGMDGVAGLNQAPIAPGETFVYEFTVRYPGTFMYHPHYDEMTQMALGMAGMFIVHPRRARGPKVDRDFVLMTHEWRLDVGAKRIDPNEMTDFNLLTFNSKAFPGTQPLLVGRGERVRPTIVYRRDLAEAPVYLRANGARTREVLRSAAARSGTLDIQLVIHGSIANAPYAALYLLTDYPGEAISTEAIEATPLLQLQPSTPADRWQVAAQANLRVNLELVGDRVRLNVLS